MNDLGVYVQETRTKKGLSKRALAEAADISHTEVHRIENGQRQNPSPPVLRAISNALGVPYEELMRRAGYINTQEEMTVLDKSDTYEDKFIGILAPKLFKDGWAFEPCPPSSIGDILARKNDMEWIITFKYIDNFSSISRVAQETLFRIYGQLAVFDVPFTKFTIVLNNETAYKIFLKFLPVNLNANISVMLIDFESNTIIEEKEIS